MLRPLLRRFRKSHLETLPSQQAYAQWAEQYPAQAHNAFMQCETAAMQVLMPDLQDTIVLDLACGTGRWGHFATEKGARRVMGFDNSAAMLNVGILGNVAQADMDAIPLANRAVDIILCGLAVGHLPQARLHKSLTEMARVLQPNGLILISDLHPFQAWHGAKRTFTGRDGQTYAVEHYPHSYADYFRIACSVGLTIDGVVEQKLATDKPPVILALRLRKSSEVELTDEVFEFQPILVQE